MNLRQLSHAQTPARLTEDDMSLEANPFSNERESQAKRSGSLVSRLQPVALLWDCYSADHKFIINNI